MTNKKLLQPLEQVAVIEVSGSDAAKFLQRQLAVEVSELTVNRSRLGAYLNPKGRVIANFLMVMGEGEYYLVLEKDMADSLTKRLRMYVFRDQVEFTNQADLVFAVGQPKPQTSFCELPEEVLQTRIINNLTTIRMPSISIQYGIIAKKDKLVNASSMLEAISSEIWPQRNIEAGIPWIGSATSEMFIAQAINLDLVDSVSWTKGCYPGQEIVARLHYRGGINRRMFYATSDAVADASPGASISCPDLPGNQTGTVVNCSHLNGTIHLLVSVPLKFIGQTNLLISKKYPVTLQTNRLPYVVPELEGSNSDSN